MTKNRRSFLKAAGLAAGITSAAPLALTLQGTGIATGAAPGPRPATRGGFALELEGSVVGSLRGYSGGFPFGEVRLARIGTGPVDKAIAGVGFEDIRLEAGAAMDASIWSWIGAMLSGSPTSKSGAILMMDGDYSLTHRLEFRDAYISEVTFPQFDGASKDAAFLTIGIAPERTEFKVASGAGIPAGGRQKRWLASNFRLSIPGLPSETVSRVDAFTVRQVFTEERLVSLRGFAGIGHTRYSTTGASVWDNAQPTFRATNTGTLALAHNGNLTNTDELESWVADLDPRSPQNQFRLLPGTYEVNYRSKNARRTEYSLTKPATVESGRTITLTF